MSTREEFENIQETIKESIKEFLEENGDLDEMKCKLRQKIFKFVRADGDGDNIGQPQENKNSSIQLLNSLIKDYFQWCCHLYTLDMFKTETGDRSEDQPRESLEEKLKKLGSGDFDKELPLLLQIVMDSMK